MIMGLFDFFLTEKQKKEKVATRIGLACGAFQECPVCRDVTEDGSYAENAAKVEAFVDERIMLPADDDMKLFQGNKQELLETVKSVAEKLPAYCTCESN